MLLSFKRAFASLTIFSPHSLAEIRFPCLFYQLLDTLWHRGLSLKRFDKVEMPTQLAKIKCAKCNTRFKIGDQRSQLIQSLRKPLRKPLRYVYIRREIDCLMLEQLLDWLIANLE